jgi:glycine oxidase
LIGRSGEDGLILACGHYRNGILLAPVTATIVLDALAGGTAPDSVEPSRRAAQAALA